MQSYWKTGFHANDLASRRAQQSHRGPIGVCRRTNVVVLKTTCAIGYADENFDLSGTFDYVPFDSKEDAYAEWLRIDKENIVSQKSHNVHILSKWTNLFGADDWERHFPTIVIINSPMWLKLVSRARTI